MIVAIIIISVFFCAHILYLLCNFLNKDNFYNQNVTFQGGKEVGVENSNNRSRILQNNVDQTDTVVKGMRVPTAPVTSSFSGLSIRINHINTGAYYDVYLENQLVIGREGGSAFVQISDSMISQKHCMIYRKGEQVFLQDLNSTNHTYLNGCILENPMPLSSGDVINIGRSTLQYQCFYMKN